MKKKCTHRKVIHNHLSPESLGLVVGTVYLTIAIMFQPIFGSIVRRFISRLTEYSQIGQYNAALTAIWYGLIFHRFLIRTSFMILLGFADDVLDLRWAIKIGLSFLGTLRKENMN